MQKASGNFHDFRRPFPGPPLRRIEGFVFLAFLVFLVFLSSSFLFFFPLFLSSSFLLPLPIPISSSFFLLPLFSSFPLVSFPLRSRPADARRPLSPAPLGRRRPLLCRLRRSAGDAGPARFFRARLGLYIFLYIYSYTRISEDIFLITDIPSNTRMASRM